jgi:hypothetical protein
MSRLTARYREDRKGWDILLQAYFEEFSASDKVSLFLQTYLYQDFDPHNQDKILSRVYSFASLNVSLHVNDKLTGMYFR